MFQIVELAAGGGFIPVCENDEPLLFPDGRSAAAKARELCARFAKKYQPRPIKDENWRLRESKRFNDGTHEPPPWQWEPWWVDSEPQLNHFCHVSKVKPGMVAFTETPEKGMADIQTRIKPGRYLERYFGHTLDQYDIQAWANAFAAEYEDNRLLFAETADEIEEVYREGPGSCMSNEEYREEKGWGVTRDGIPGCFSSPFHPCRIYAAGDLQVAYLKSHEEIIARSVVWPAKKLYSRIYRDIGRMANLLQAAGYKPGSPIGARLVRRPIDDAFVMPYIDWGKTSGMGSCQCVDKGTHLEIVGPGDGTIDCGNLSGLSCEVEHEEEEEEEEEHDCMANDEVWSRDYFERHGFQCDHCGDRHHNDDATPSLSYGILIETWCPDCATDTFICSETGDRYPDSEKVTLPDGRAVCQAWADAHPEETETEK